MIYAVDRCLEICGVSCKLGITGSITGSIPGFTSLSDETVDPSKHKHTNTYLCSRRKSRQHFQDKNTGRIRVKCYCCISGVDADAARREEEEQMMADANQWLNNKTVKEQTHPKTGATALHVASAKGYVKVMK